LLDIHTIIGVRDAFFKKIKGLTLLADIKVNKGDKRLINRFNKRAITYCEFEREFSKDYFIIYPAFWEIFRNALKYDFKVKPLVPGKLKFLEKNYLEKSNKYMIKRILKFIKENPGQNFGLFIGQAREDILTYIPCTLDIMRVRENDDVVEKEKRENNNINIRFAMRNP